MICDQDYELFGKRRPLLDPITLFLCRVQDEFKNVGRQGSITPELINLVKLAGTTDISTYLNYTESAVILRDYVLHAVAFGSIRLSRADVDALVSVVPVPVRLSVILLQNRLKDKRMGGFDNSKTEFTFCLKSNRVPIFMNIARTLRLVVGTNAYVNDVPEFNSVRALDLHEMYADSSGIYSITSNSRSPSYRQFLAAISYITHLYRRCT
jgi:hypothetical protein